MQSSTFFFFNDTATTEIYTLSLHDALPIWSARPRGQQSGAGAVSPMPRFIVEAGCEKLAQAMVKGRLPAHVSAVLALLLLAAADASAQNAPPTLGVLVNQVLALFPKVNGEVLEVQGTTLTLSLGQRDGLVAGVELTAYRQGRELRHPKTGEVLGRTEEVLGRVTVQGVQEAYATGAVVEGTDIRPGDKVRGSAGGKKSPLPPLVEGVRGDLAEAVTYELIY